MLQARAVFKPEQPCGSYVELLRINPPFSGDDGGSLRAQDVMPGMRTGLSVRLEPKEHFLLGKDVESSAGATW